jgi:hypothetical protein
LVLFYLLDFIITKTIILQYSYVTYIMFTIPNREKVESSPVNKIKTFLHKVVQKQVCTQIYISPAPANRVNYFTKIK